MSEVQGAEPEEAGCGSLLRAGIKGLAPRGWRERGAGTAPHLQPSTVLDWEKHKAEDYVWSFWTTCVGLIDLKKNDRQQPNEASLTALQPLPSAFKGPASDADLLRSDFQCEGHRRGA